MSGGGHGSSSGGDGGKSGFTVGSALVVAAVLAVLVVGGISWPFGNSKSTDIAEHPSVIINNETLLLSRRSDGGMETEPFFVGIRRVGVPIGNQQCIHIGRNGKKVVLVGTDGAYDDSFEAYYKSASKKTVKVTVIYYPFSSTFCEHLHKGKQAEDDGNA
jgi:hypothetical protein